MSETNSGFRPDGVREALREAWTDLLGVDTVTSSSNFYSEGGTSLIAADLLARMRGNGLKARLAELMACRTFTEQLELFSAGQADLSETRESGLGMRQELRLNRIVQQIQENGTGGVAPLALVAEIAGDIDHDLLIQSMIDLVRRHDVLSIGFINYQGEIAPTQSAMADSWKPGKLDLSAFSREQAQARIWRLVAETVNQGLAFDTTTVVLGTVAIVRPDVSIAVLVVDHVVCDAESLDILFDDLAQIYSAKVEGRPPDLPGLQTPVLDALVEADRHRVSDWPILTAKWKDLIDGYPAPPAFDLIGAIGSRDYSQTVPSPAMTIKFVLPAETVTKLKTTYRQLGLSPLSVMLGATYLTAHIISGAQDICIVNPYSRRYSVGAIHNVNDFTETSVIRIRHPGTSCPCKLALAEVAALAASSHAKASELEMPFAMIIRAITHDGTSRAASAADGNPADLRARPDHGEGQLVTHVHGAQTPRQVVPWLWCNYWNSGPRSRRMGDAVATMLDAPFDAVLNAPNLGVYIADNGNDIQVLTVAPEKLYESDIISEFGSVLNRILRQFGENPGASMSASGHYQAFSRT